MFGEIKIRTANINDLPEIKNLIDSFALTSNHPSANIDRNLGLYAKAYFSSNSIAEIIVVEMNNSIIGTIQWTLSFDMFWSKFIAIPEWLYTKKEFRGTGIILSLFSFMCNRVKKQGGVAVYIFANKNTFSLLDRICMGNGANSHYYLSGKAFMKIADLHDKKPKFIIGNLPDKEMNYIE